MFRDNRFKSMKAQLKTLPAAQIPQFLEQSSGELAAMKRSQLNEMAEIVMSLMIPSSSLDEYVRFEDDMDAIIKYFGAAVIAPKLAEYIKLHVKDVLPFIEKNAVKISAMFTPEQLVMFLSEMIDNVFNVKHANLLLSDLSNKLVYTVTDYYFDEDDRLLFTGDTVYEPSSRHYVKPPQSMQDKGDTKMNLMSADEIYKFCKTYAECKSEKTCTSLTSCEENKKTIRDLKTVYDVKAEHLAASNLKLAATLIALFAGKLSAVSDIQVVKQLLEKLKLHDVSCRESVASIEIQDKCTLVLPFLCAMRQAIKQKDIETMVLYIAPNLRAQFIVEQNRYLEQRAKKPSRSLFHKAQSPMRIMKYTNQLSTSIVHNRRLGLANAQPTNCHLGEYNGDRFFS